MARGLNVRERRFVDALLGSCAGNGTEAAIVSGYTRTRTRNRNAAGVVANRLLRKPKIRAAIDARLARASGESIADAAERDAVLTAIMRNPAADDFARIAAIRELNKCSGRHSIKHVLDASEKYRTSPRARERADDASETSGTPADVPRLVEMGLPRLVGVTVRRARREGRRGDEGEGWSR